MEIWNLQNTPLCLPAQEIHEVIQEVVQEAEVYYGHPEYAMEEVVAYPVVSEDQRIEVSLRQQSARTSFGEIPNVLLKTIEEMKADNALVKERLDRQEMMFQLILSRLLPLPP